FVKYGMHAVGGEEQQEVDLQAARYDAPEDPVQGTTGVNQAAVAEAAAQAQQQPQGDGQVPADPSADDTPMQPVIKSDHEKIGRNEPCWCGSGKKFKMCHGR